MEAVEARVETDERAVPIAPIEVGNEPGRPVVIVPKEVRCELIGLFIIEDVAPLEITEERLKVIF